MFSPGFNGQETPNAETNRSLQWLAKQIVEDERFASGTVKFWWPAIFGEPIIERPIDASANNYDQQLLIHEAQNAEIERLAELFRSGTAGLALHGAYNLKDLLLEMILSPLV